GHPVHLGLEVKRVDVIFPSTGARMEARVDAIDPDLDLAVLSVPASDLPAIAMADSDALEPGEPVQVFGFPFGRSADVGRTRAARARRPARPSPRSRAAAWPRSARVMPATRATSRPTPASTRAAAAGRWWTRTAARSA